MKTIFFYIITSLLIVASPIHAQDKNKMTILNQQPVFEIKLEGFGVQYVIELNGVNVFSQYNSAGKIETKIPVNHYMRSGKNKLAIITWPDHGETLRRPNGYVSAELLVSEHQVPDNSFSIGSLHFNNKTELEIDKIQSSSQAGVLSSHHQFKIEDSGDVVIGEVEASQSGNIFEYEREFNIPSSIPLWAFFSSDELPNYNEMNDDDYYKNMDILLIEYLKVQNAIAENKVDNVLAMFEERNNELDAAFYNSPGTLKAKIESALKDAANDDTAELIPLTTKKVNFLISRINKLAKLTRNGQKAAIVLNYKEIEGSYRFDLIFRLQDGKWILTR